ncbi:hypothetical protein K450DRAFT_220824 [Umbelopsis ramanniana AG]|uniref:Uncharacterized protein n=1 Tax=Umbelopsis ramanniana AG TaxID=1314678 RepID=A0AAD5HID5_UMBRA|nr:uncharacterized protein K450DRAFT_220824 [Umbelopsis ramanniana AG]KAI8583964.1 hypothetical protein K450DRAFT_220824 [Umbelopsis ramanniana AG]
MAYIYAFVFILFAFNFATPFHSRSSLFVLRYKFHPAWHFFRHGDPVPGLNGEVS